MTPPDRSTWDRPDQPYDFGPYSRTTPPPVSAGWPDQDARYVGQGPRYIEPRRRSWVARHKILTGLAALVVLVIVLSAVSAVAGTSSAPPSPGLAAAGTTPAKPGAGKPQPRKPATSIPGNATVLIRTELQPGTYRTSGPDAELQGLGLPCYWQRSRSTNGTGGDIIANGAPSGPAVVTILPTDVAFTSNGCNDWQRIS